MEFWVKLVTKNIVRGSPGTQLCIWGLSKTFISCIKRFDNFIRHSFSFSFWNIISISNLFEIPILVEILNNFEYDHLQNGFYLKNNLNQMLVILLFYLFLLLIQILLLMLLFFDLYQYCLCIRIILLVIISLNQL